jgi:hypothetical protein
MNAIFLKTPYTAVLSLCDPSFPTPTPFLTNTAQLLCAQQVWEALLTAFPLKHKRMQTVLLARDTGRLMAWDRDCKNAVKRECCLLVLNLVSSTL